MRVLVADDDAVMRDRLAHLLGRAGYDVELACDGTEALQALRQGVCQLVVCDWSMPRMTGDELCRAIRSENFSNYIYVILLTANGQDFAVNGLSAGADDFVTKPFNSPELIARVRAGERVLALEHRDMVIFALAALAESRDLETGEHLQRMQSYSRELAACLLEQGQASQEVTPEFCRLIYQTSVLHDIGKVGVPDSVLLKPGPLTDEEFEVMKTHTTLGAKTLDAALAKYPSARFLQMGRDIAAAHHEKWSGSGYPNALSGSDIPLCGRIVALADVYDALTSKRVYKPAWSHAEARSEILSQAGVHFDPMIVEAFLARETRFDEIRQLFKEKGPIAA